MSGLHILQVGAGSGGVVVLDLQPGRALGDAGRTHDDAADVRARLAAA